MKQSQNLRSHPEVFKIFKEHSREICIRVDRGFSILLLIQWFASIILAAWLFPETRFHHYYEVEGSIVMATVLGGVFSLPALACVRWNPGKRLTRVVVGLSQISFSILIIHLTGGRIEAHFHVLLSIAFLAFYLDPLVLGLASALAIADHLVRGCFIPMSIYGEMAVNYYKLFEHSLWILFENVVLLTAVSYLRADLRERAVSKYQLILAREEALRASSMKSMFLSNMSHEIRTPLNSIMGFTEILWETSLDEDQKSYLGTIQRCSQSLMRLLNDILDLSKIENGLMQIDRHKFNMRELHCDVHKMFEIQCRDKGISFDIQVNEEVPEHVIGDSHRIRQILVNLIANAVKFTEKGRVSVVVEHDMEKSVTRWQVVDTGVGIPFAAQEKLFKRFIQADASVSRKYGGSGLGLIITKNLVELMGGTLHLCSKVDEGTKFSFILPLEKS
ncbi:MAG: sensor histidine kinase [Bacillota bacterium]